MHKVFKPQKKTDELKCAYLYADGHLVTTFERRTEVGTLSYCKVAEKLTRPIDCTNEETRYSLKGPKFSGRIVFHNPLCLAACLSLPDIHVLVAWNNGSEATRRDGIHIDSVYLRSGTLQTVFTFNCLPQLSSGITIQDTEVMKPEVWSDLAERYYWGDSQIVERFPAEKPQPQTETEAA